MPEAAVEHSDGPVIGDRDEFIEELHALASTEAVDLLGERAVDCPYIDAWFERNRDRDPESLERMARRYTGLGGATSRRELLAAIRARLRLGIAYWQNDEDLAGELALAGLHETAAASIDGAIAGDPLAVHRVIAELGEGEPLPSGARLHRDPRAAQLAERANAHAFTIGRNVVLGPTAPAPDTMAGDLLLAHELEHVEQQRTRGSGAPSHDGERAANEAAIGQSRRSVPTRLSLQRCKKGSDDPAPVEKTEAEKYEERLAELKKIEEAKGSFGDVAAAMAEERAVEHWLAVAKGGKGPRTGKDSLEPDLPKCDCTTYVVDILEATFTAMGQKAQWDKVRKKALKLKDKTQTGINGIPLQRALESELGWRGVFWAPDPGYAHYMKRKRDAQGNVVLDASGNEVWIPDTEHSAAWQQVKDTGKYYKVQVDYSAVNFAPETGGSKSTPDVSTTKKDTSGLDKLKKIPFGVLTARGARHMALLVHGVVYEVHWDQQSGSADLYQATPLEDWGWDSGVVVAPPGDVAKAFGK